MSNLWHCLEQHSQIVADLAQQYADDAITQEELKSAGNEALLSIFSKLKSENKLLIGDDGAILVSSRSSHRGYNYFSTYAWNYIRRAMENAVFERKYHTRVPTRYAEFINKFTRENNDYPTPKEMAEAVQCSVKHAQNILSITLIETINKLNRISHQLMQKSGTEPTAEELAVAMELSVAKVQHVLKIAKKPKDTLLSKDRLRHFFDRELGPREAKVLQMRYGIDVNQDYTLEEVGRQFDVTRERIRQIEAKALRKMRHPRREKKLRQRMENE